MILNFKEFTPVIGSNSWIAPNAYVIGRTEIGDDSSVWFSATVRGDVNFIRIGNRTNIQDGSVLHVTGPDPENNPDGFPLIIGDNVTIGHKVMLHGCIINNSCLIGMSATILDGVEIGEESLIGAGALITQNKKFPPRSLILGSPAVRVRELKENEIKMLYQSADHYASHKNIYLIKG